MDEHACRYGSMKTVDALAISIPKSILVRENRVIE